MLLGQNWHKTVDLVITLFLWFLARRYGRQADAWIWKGKALVMDEQQMTRFFHRGLHLINWGNANADMQHSDDADGRTKENLKCKTQKGRLENLSKHGSIDADIRLSH